MMMMTRQQSPRSNPTVQIPSTHFAEDPTTHIYENALSALQRFLPSNAEDDDVLTEDFDVFSSDQFRMFDFKVKKCARARSHDWTECPYAHPGEKARRRDPRKFHYSGEACSDFRRGGCVKGELCEFAHGVFECWLHPARYRTQPCKDGVHCRRRVCFFAHTPEQLRVLNGSEDSGRLGGDSVGLGGDSLAGLFHEDDFLSVAASGFISDSGSSFSPSRLGGDSVAGLSLNKAAVTPMYGSAGGGDYVSSPSRLGCDSLGGLSHDPHFRGRVGFVSSPTSTLYSPLSSPTTVSPPVSPSGSLSLNSVSGLAESMKALQLNKVRMGLGSSMSPPSWGMKMGSGFGSPRSPSGFRPGFMSLPTTPIQAPARSGLRAFDIWETSCEEEPAMERVESGRELREKIYAKLSKENSLGRVGPTRPDADFGWVSELVN